MKRNLLLYILLAFLVVMNGFFLFKQFGKTEKKGQQRGGSPSSFLAKQLKFDNAQTAQFEKLDAQHRKNMDALLEDMKGTKDVLFDKISDTHSTSDEIDSIAQVIGKKEARKELEIFNFFKAIEDVCNEEQKVRFRSIIKDALRPQEGRPGNGPPPHGGRPGPGGENGPPPPRH